MHFYDPGYSDASAEKFNAFLAMTAFLATAGVFVLSAGVATFLMVAIG